MWGSAKLAFCMELEKELKKDRASETSAFEYGFLDLLRTSNTVQVHRQDDGGKEVTVFGTSFFSSAFSSFFSSCLASASCQIRRNRRQIKPNSVAKKTLLRYDGMLKT